MKAGWLGGGVGAIVGDDDTDLGCWMKAFCSEGLDAKGVCDEVYYDNNGCMMTTVQQAGDRFYKNITRVWSAYVQVLNSMMAIKIALDLEHSPR